MFCLTECVMTWQDSQETVCCQAWSSRLITRGEEASLKAEWVKLQPLVYLRRPLPNFSQPKSVARALTRPVQLTFYSRHPSRFIRLDSKAFRASRWTWGLCSWWAVHIARQPRYLWTDGAARLNPEVLCQCRSRYTTIFGAGGSV